MINSKEASLKTKNPNTRFLYLWREVGLFLLTVSLLFLPWFRDPYPPAGRPPLVTGIEFVNYGVWLVPLAYVLALTAYIVSKFSKSKWVSVIPFVGAFLVFFYVFFNTLYTRFNPPGIPLDRWNGLMDKQFTLSVGMWFNWMGLLALLVGFYYAETGRRRTAVLSGVLGAFVGIILFIITSAFKPEPYFMTSVRAYAFSIIGTIIGSWLVLRMNSVVRNNKTGDGSKGTLMKTETSSASSKVGILLFSTWREVGVLLITVSLFLLPWFRDLDPPAGRSPLITGVEFLTYSAWPVILGYAAACLSYIVSRFSNKKWAGMIILVIAVLFYLYVHLVFGVSGIRYDPPGFPLGRGHHIEAEEIFPAMIGIWVNWIGLIFLTIGLYLAERGRGRAAVSFAIVGALLGFCLLVGSIFAELALPELLDKLTFLPRSIRNNDTLYQFMSWVQIFGLPFCGAILGAWFALKKGNEESFSIE